jgi:hypothetical protein
VCLDIFIASSKYRMMVFAVTATTTAVPFLRVKMLLRDFNTQSGLSSGFSGFSVVFAKPLSAKEKEVFFPHPAVTI